MPEPLTVVACAAESGRRAAVLAEAMRECRRRSARLILYDIDAPSRWVDAFPEFGADRWQHPLSPPELRELGRRELAAQVELTRADGIDAYGWLPSEPNADALVVYAEAHGAETIMLSRQLEEPSFLQRVNHLTASRAKAAARGKLEVRFVEGDESWTRESEMPSTPVNVIDAAATGALGSRVRASRVLTVIGIVFLATAVLVSGSVVWAFSSPSALLFAAGAAAVGVVFVASAPSRTR